MFVNGLVECRWCELDAKRLAMRHGDTLGLDVCWKPVVSHG
jgi:hypothetical protein